MSWYLVVATHLPPATRTLFEWAATHAGVEVDGALDSVHGSAIVRRHLQGAAPRACAIVYPPEPVTEDALPAMLAEAVLQARFRLRISVPGASAEDRELAASLAAAIAEDSQGAVLDPQAEEIVAPEKARRASRRFAVRCAVPATLAEDPEAVVEVGVTDAHGQTHTLRESYAVLAGGAVRCRVVRVVEADDGRELVLVETGSCALELTRDQLVEA